MDIIYKCIGSIYLPFERPLVVFFRFIRFLVKDKKDIIPTLMCQHLYEVGTKL